MQKVTLKGSRRPRFLIVGEAPGEKEEQQGRPFVGPSGFELDKMLAEAGINQSECAFTNVCRYRPPGNKVDKWIKPKTKAQQHSISIKAGKKTIYPDKIIVEGYNELAEEIRQLDPDIIIPVGNLALWATTGNWFITKWRSSILECNISAPKGKAKVIPTLHPASILRRWDQRPLVVHDLRRAMTELQTNGRKIIEPERLHIIRPKFSYTKGFLRQILLDRQPITCDIETIGRNIGVVGFGRSAEHALCIPFMHTDGTSYWTPEQEFQIVKLIRGILADPRIEKIGQNFMYDSQYFVHHWGIKPQNIFDTMVCHHVLFPGLPKSLDYLSSMFCQFHRFWKDDGKEIDTNEDEERWWIYNCEDCTRTYEVANELKKLTHRLKMQQQVDFLHQTFEPMLDVMIRGVLIDLRAKEKLSREVKAARQDLLTWLKSMIPYTVTDKFPGSNKQLGEFFVDSLGVKPVWKYNKQNGKYTMSFDDSSLKEIANQNIWLKRFTEAIALYRSLGTVKANVLDAETGTDGRMRCFYNIAGPESFRLSSKQDAFGQGCNLQNITAGREED